MLVCGEVFGKLEHGRCTWLLRKRDDRGNLQIEWNNFREDVFKKRLEVEVGGEQVMKAATKSPEDVSHISPTLLVMKI